MFVNATFTKFVFIFRKYKAEEHKTSSASYSITSILYKIRVKKVKYKKK